MTHNVLRCPNLSQPHPKTIAHTRCMACGAADAGPLFAHPEWSLIRPDRVQRLQGLAALCRGCYNVRNSLQRVKKAPGGEGAAAWKPTAEHLMAVNDWSEAQARPGAAPPAWDYFAMPSPPSGGVVSLVSRDVCFRRHNSTSFTPTPRGRSCSQRGPGGWTCRGWGRRTGRGSPPRGGRWRCQSFRPCCAGRWGRRRASGLRIASQGRPGSRAPTRRPRQPRQELRALRRNNGSRSSSRGGRRGSRRRRQRLLLLGENR